MITIKDFMEVVDYRITDGGEYLWKCYGDHTHRLDAEDPENTEFTITTVFDTKTQVVYEMDAWDYKRNVTYRWINPDFIKAVKKEYKKRGLTFKQCIDDRNYIDLDVEEDILEKAKAIAAGEEYDPRVIISVDMDDETLVMIARAAHALDITINDFMVKALEEAVERDGVE
jgi:hypothetical protein